MDKGRYKVESRPIIDIVRDVQTGRLVVSPYFQRDLVWREAHKKEFIETILKGFPFPLIFVSRGYIDVEKMEVVSLLVDGQQRVSTIIEYIAGNLYVRGQSYSDLSATEKEEFLKYEVPVIDLDLPEGDVRIKEIFQRLNRTFYSLTEIERLSTEYASSEFMLCAKLMCRQMSVKVGSIEAKEEERIEEEFSDLSDAVISKRDLDPNVPPEFIKWAQYAPVKKVQTVILQEAIFSPYELSRKVHLMFSLNILATIIEGKFYSRNERIRPLLFEYATGVSEKDQIFTELDAVCDFVIKMKLGAKSYWKTKANAFSLIVCLYRNRHLLRTLDPTQARDRLNAFQSKLTSEYQLAAREAVNRKRERMIRNSYIQVALFPHLNLEETGPEE